MHDYFYLNRMSSCYFLVVVQEKIHQSIFEGVEHFDKTAMKHTETMVKNVLPDPEGRHLVYFFY